MVKADDLLARTAKFCHEFDSTLEIVRQYEKLKTFYVIC